MISVVRSGVVVIGLASFLAFSGCGSGPDGTLLLVFTVPPSTSQTNANIAPAIQVTVEDAAGHPLTDSTAVVTLSLGTNPAPASLVGESSTAAWRGIASFDALSIDRPGNGYKLVASAPGARSVISAPFDVTAAPPTRLAFVAQPANTVAAVKMTPPVRVAFEDAHGNVRPDAKQFVMLAVGNHGGPGTLSGSLTVEAVDGIATFPDLSIDRIGQGYTLAATAAGYAGAESSPFDIRLGSPSAALSQLTAVPAAVVADGASIATLTLAIEDAGGNPVAGQALKLSSTGSANTLSASSGSTDPSGIFTATLSSTKAELKTITANCGDVDLSTTVNFVAGFPTANTSSFVASPTTVIANGTATSTLTVTLADSHQNPVAGHFVQLSSSGSGNQFSATSGTTDGSGVFVATLASTKAERKSLTATIGSLTLSAAVTFTTTTPLCDSTLLFPSVPTVDTETQPSVIASGDIDGDGKIDLVTANATDVTVLFGRGKGLFDFTVNSSHALGEGPQGIAAVDLNRDGNLDIVSVGYAVNVMLGRGDGTFQPTSRFATNTNAAAVTVGDFNVDGRLDLATANVASKSVSVFLGHGDGSFDGPINFAVGTNPQAITSGDFNDDGKLDLVTANNGSNDVSVLLGNGDGSFQAAANFAAGGLPSAVATGDFNGDGRLDLAATNTFSNDVSVLLGKGDGTLQAAVNYGVGVSPRALVVGDFNFDGKEDLAALGPNDVSVLLGAGNGTFSVGGRYDTGVSSNAMTMADFNRDGTLDLATSNGGSGDVRILLGTGTGTFRSHFDVAAAGKDPISIATADFDGDAKLDIVTANSLAQEFAVLLGNGDGTFKSPSVVAAPQNVNSVITADLNNDGKPDLITVSVLAVAVLIGNGDGTFQSPVSYALSSYSYSILAGDFNGDGNLDIAGAIFGGSVGVLLGNGDGTLRSPVYYRYSSGGNPYSIVSGDYNRDGAIDLAVDNGDYIFVMLGKGDGSFPLSAMYPLRSASRVMTSGDFNGDGKLDLVAISNNGSGFVGALLGNGDGTFGSGLYADYGIGLPALVYSVTAGDFNGDGRLDVVTGDSNAAVVNVLFGNGDGTFGLRVNYGTGLYPQTIAAADLNGDGRLDVASANRGSNNVSVLLNTGCLR